MMSYGFASTAALVTLIALSGAAQAQNADWQTCAHKARTLAHAMAKHRDAADLEAVRIKRGQALRECSSGFYRLGIYHYEVALKMLKEADNSHTSS